MLSLPQNHFLSPKKLYLFCLFLHGIPAIANAAIQFKMVLVRRISTSSAIYEMQHYAVLIAVVPVIVVSSTLIARYLCYSRGPRIHLLLNVIIILIVSAVASVLCGIFCDAIYDIVRMKRGIWNPEELFFLIFVPVETFVIICGYFIIAYRKMDVSNSLGRPIDGKK